MKSFNSLAQMVCRMLSVVSVLRGVYAAMSAIVEAEVLYEISHSTGVVPSIGKIGGRVATVKRQRDVFLDIRHDGQWLLAEGDYYWRHRIVTDLNDNFLSGEIKLAYPGTATHRSRRPALDHSVSAEEGAEVVEMMRKLGFTEEREYQKTRTPCILFTDEGKIELEIDDFADSPCNGLLAGRSFLSTSIELSNGQSAAQAEAVLELGRTQLLNAGCELTPVSGNYEDLFYGRVIVK